MNENLFALPVLDQPAPSVTRRRIGEIPILVVDHPRVRGAVSLQGAQVLTWQPVGGAPGLWLGERNAWTAGTAIRGGVPLCWPWFGAVAKPSHGFARVLDWDLVSLDTTEEGVELVLRLEASDVTRALWPHEFTLTTRITLGATCSIEVEATGEHRSTAALHTYLAIGALGEAEVSGLGKHYRDNLLAVDVDDAGGEVTPTGHIERVYTEPEEVSSVRDGALGHVLELAHREASDVVVWNPGAELAAGMADLTDDDHRRFLCVETGRVSTPLESEPGRPARLAVTLSLLPHTTP
ncbi:D-hexose-6-phosphate mutarotase [Streptomyces sp. NPDC059564]|uniref:D-hexose-6-phosphate mutarotase n=1 Tax=Streptomyces sp. NPDC059564 TaxID=3346865 RepID=UPI0036AE0F0B